MGILTEEWELMSVAKDLYTIRAMQAGLDARKVSISEEKYADYIATTMEQIRL